MKIFKEIFGRIWALWGLITFAVTLCLVAIPITLTFLIKEPNGVKVFKAISRVWINAYLFLIGCRMHVTGKQYYNPKKQYVVVANHQSFLDVLLLTPFFPGPNKTIAKKSLSRIPIFGWVYTRGSVLVERGSDASRVRSFEAMKNVILKQHLNMVVYPEGTRNRTGKPLKNFYDGAFKLAMSCDKEIIPAIILNTAKALPTNKAFFMWPTHLEMHILPPVSSENKTKDQLKAEVYEQMWQHIESYRQETQLTA